MSLKTGLNKLNEDKQKIKNSAPSQAVSPLTERVVNGNTNPDSTKMSGTQAAQQGAMNQLGKDPQAVQNGALAQQQQGMQQQRNLQDQGQSLADFRSEGVEQAQEAANQKAEQWASSMSQFGSLGNRVSTAVQEELAAGGEVAQQFQVNQEIMDNAVASLATPGMEDASRQAMTDITAALQQGDSSAAINTLINNANAFNVDTTNSSAALTTIFQALDISPAQQQSMVADALTEGVVDADNLNMQFLLDQGILTTDNAMIPELGLEVSEIEEMIGPEWRDMTVGEIESQLELNLDDKAERDDIMRELANPNIDPTRKAELQQELQLLDASGASESEEMAARALDRVGAADQINMGGELRSVEDVLSDDAINAASNDLMMRIQEDPENADQILAEWKEQNPGYEQMGDWVKENQENMANMGEEVKSAQELVEKKNKEAAEFVNDNELFGADTGAKAVLEELGFNTEGFGALGNDAASNPTYQALKNFKDSNPEQFEFFNQNLMNMDPEDLKGLNGADINTIMQTLGTREGMEEFNYLRELNNELAITDANSYKDVMRSILPEDSPLNTVLGTPESAQNYLSGLTKLKKMGVMTPELEAFSELMDSDGDGKIDNPAEVADRVKELMGEGFDMSNFQGAEANQLLDMMNQSVADIDGIVTKQMQTWDQTEGKLARKKQQDASLALKDSDIKNPWMKGGKITGAGHPSAKSWQKAFHAGSKHPNTARRQGERTFAALAKNPKLFDTLPERTGNPVEDMKKQKAWFEKNIGYDKGSKLRKDTQFLSFFKNLNKAGGGKGDLKAGAKAIFEKDINNAAKLKKQYDENLTASKNEAKNPWSNF